MYGYRYVSMCLFVYVAMSGFPANAEENNWKAGFRIGPSFYTQTVISSLDASGDPGPVLNGQILYRINEYLSAGSMLGFEYHSIDGGDAYTVSLYPVVIEAGPGRINKFEPYGTLGLGININNASADNFDNVSVDNTFAFRIGAGTDFYLFDNLALNTELAWQLNSGDGEVSGLGKGDFNASGFQFLLGARVPF